MINARILTLLFTSILVCSVFIPFITPSAIASPAVKEDTITGAAIPLSTQEEQNYLNDMEQWTESLPLSTKSHAFTLMTESRTWIIYTDQKPQTGVAQVSGTVVAKDSGVGILFADSVSVRTQGTEATIDDVQNNPGRYAFDLVEITGDYRQIPVSVEATDQASKQLTAGTLAERPFPFTSGFEYPGQMARWGVLNLSTPEFGAGRYTELARRTAGQGDSLVIGGEYTEFAINATTTVTALVLPRPPQSLPSTSQSDGQPSLLLVDTDIQGQQLQDVQEINEQGSSLERQVITIEAQTIGTRLSSKKFLLSVAQCAPESVAVPVAPPGCVPVTTDSILHSGVLFSGIPTSQDEVVPYAGLSNVPQSQLLEQEQGTYSVTGRVVSTSQIDPSLPEGYALLVYEMERVDGLSVTAQVRQQGREHANSVTSALKSQIETGQENWEEQRVADDMKVEVTELSSQEVSTGSTVQVHALVNNTGNQRADYTVTFKVDGEVVASKTVGFMPQEFRVVNATFSQNTAGEVSVTVNNESAGTVRFVTDESEASSNTKTDSDEGSTSKPKQDADSQTHTQSGNSPDTGSQSEQETTVGGFGEVEAPVPGFGMVTSMGAFLLILLFIVKR